MSEEPGSEIGEIGWVDLTVPDADSVRAFYGQVVGWSSTSQSMGEYDDYTMHAPGSGKAVIHGPRSVRDRRFCVIEDPVGAAAQERRMQGGESK